MFFKSELLYPQGQYFLEEVCNRLRCFRPEENDYVYYTDVTGDFSSCGNKTVIFTFRNRSCGKVMFSQACVKNSVHRGREQRGEVYIPPWADTPPSSQADTTTPPADTTPPVDTTTIPTRQTLPGHHHPGQTPPPPLRQTGTAADGTHPTGMHSCRFIRIMNLLTLTSLGCDVLLQQTINTKYCRLLRTHGQKNRHTHTVSYNYSINY